MSRRTLTATPFASWLTGRLAKRDYIEVCYEELLGAAGLPVERERERFAEVLNLIGDLGHPIRPPLTSTLASKVRVLARPTGGGVRITRFKAKELSPTPRSPSRKLGKGNSARVTSPRPDAVELVPSHIYRVLSIQPPWAWAVIHAGKDVENRTWTTNYRGPLLIHASSRKFVGEELEEVRDVVAAGGGLSLDDVPADFPRSQLLGLVDLVDIVDDAPSRWAESGLEQWVLAHPRALKQPILDVKGKLNLWSWTA